MIRRAIALLATCGACSGATLRAPPPDATPTARLEAYARLRPVGRSRTVTLSQSSGGGATTGYDAPIVLADGTIVRHADDLLPVVADDGPAARAARASATARTRKMLVVAVGLAISGAGLAMTLTNLDDETPPAMYAGLGLLVGGAAAAGFGGWHFSRRESEHRIEAFRRYDEGLRERLELCVDGLRVVPCGVSAR